MKKFQCFGGNSICLTVTGAGPGQAACAAAHILTLKGAGRKDYMINFGSCGAEKFPALSVGDTFLCRKIMDHASGRTYYPDLFIDPSFPEADLISLAKPYDGSQARKPENVPLLYDMEASFLYQAASLFMGPDHMFFIKAVSDFGEEKIDAGGLKAACRAHEGELVDFIRKLAAYGQADHEDREEENERLLRLAEDLHCSETMRQQLISYARYFRAAGIDVESYIGEKYKDGVLPCRDKREGKRLLALMRKELIP